MRSDRLNSDAALTPKVDRRAREMPRNAHVTSFDTGESEAQFTAPMLSSKHDLVRSYDPNPAVAVRYDVR